ncbi:MAG: hypothetical protein Q7O66_22135, partial [Dehalococcoidia bacterium]|nr:hypothetical protein [Dehalococcoidia bacterium]
DGVSVRAFSRDWQAFDTTRDGGKFSFSLTFGSYTVQLVDMVAGEAALTIDGKSDLQIQFNEVDRILVTSTATLTATSPTATVTATESPTPSATPNPTSTHVPLPDTIVAVPPPEVTPADGSSFFSILPQFDPAPLFQVFVDGVGIGGAIVLAGLLLVLVRRL